MTINDDTVTYPGYDGVCVKALEGNDNIKGTYGDDRISGDSGNDTLDGRSGNDVLTGGAGDDIIFGRNGDDTLSGGSGNDTLHGGIGQDTIIGEEGNDYITAVENDLLIDGGAGFDILRIRDSNDDKIINLDMTSSSINGIEAIIGESGTEQSLITVTIDLEDILQENDDDGLSTTPDTSNTLIAIDIETLVIDSDNLWNESGLYQVTTQDLDAATEDAYLELIGSPRNLDLNAYTFTKNDGSEITIITDLSETDFYDADTGLSIEIA
ncbi:hypothetical protein [uncultured Amphritea sp.]|uniref:calcium-binding protein n=1 Tax=uncultured Amphritea sp. TaxID=981605 RepID=UPI002627632D|nr:hypothetical protein [uncultured Amphritea sp.]